MDTVRELRTYLEDLIAAVRTARAQAIADDSTDVVEAVRAALAPRYSGWEHFDRLDRNVAAVLRSLTGG
jgi:hypothetical protein